MKRLFAIALSLLMFAPQVQAYGIKAHDLNGTELSQADKEGLKGVYVPKCVSWTENLTFWGKHTRCGSKDRQSYMSQGYLSGSSAELHVTIDSNGDLVFTQA